MRTTSHRLLLAALLAALLGSMLGDVSRGQELRARGELRGIGGKGAGVPIRLLPYPDSYQRRLVDLGEASLPGAAATTVTGDGGAFELVLPHLGPWWLLIGSADELVWRHDLFPSPNDHVLDPFELPAAERITVRVLDVEGTPLAGALVVVDVEPGRDLPWGGFRPLRQAARAGDDGAASLWIVPSAMARVYAAHDGYVAEVEPWSPGRAREVSVRLSRGEPVELRAVRANGTPAARAVVRVGSSMIPLGLTDERGVFSVARPRDDELDYQVETAEGEYGAVTVPPARGAAVRAPLDVVLEPPIRLTGMLRDRDTGRGVAGAVVWSSLRPSDHASSGRDGDFELHAWSAEQGLPLHIAAAGYAPATLQLGDELRLGGDAPPILLQPILAVAGKISDAAGAPVEGARIEGRIVQARSAMPFFAPLRAASGADGTFRLDGLPADGDLAIQVTHRDFAGRDLELGAVRDASAGPPLEIVLDRGRVALGLVVGPGDEPVAGAEVELLPGEAMRFGRRRPPRPGESRLAATTGVDGAFRIARVPAGPYDLDVRREGYADAAVPGIEVPAGTGEHELGTVTLERGLVLEGRVVDTTGAGLAGARVSLHLEDIGEPAAETSSGDDGVFRFRDLRRGADALLEAALDGFAQPYAARVRVPAEDPVVIELVPAALVRGRVVTESGEGVPDAMLNVRAARPVQQRDWQGGKARTDRMGRFELELGPGDWVLLPHARVEGLTGTPHPLSVAAGEVVEDVVLEMQAGMIVFGSIVDEQDRPVPDAQVWIEQRAGHGVGSTGRSSDAAGRYRVAFTVRGYLDLSAPGEGTFTLVVNHPDYRVVRRELEPRPGEQRVDLRLERGAEISGQVVGPDGEPVAGASVAAVPAAISPDRPPRDLEPVRADSAGRFTLRGLDAGGHELHAWAPGYASGAPMRVDVAGASVEGVLLELGEGVTLRGLVRGLPVEELALVRIRAYSIGALAGSSFDFDRYAARPDFEGRFEVSGLGPGRWQVMAELERPGSEKRVVRQVDVTAGELPFLELEFGGGFTVSGEVRVYGEPAPGVTVFVLGRSGSPTQAVTDLHGRFVFPGVEPGEAMILVQHQKAVRRELIRVEGDVEVSIDLRPSRISGRVVAAATGEPIALARVQASSDAESPLEARSNAGSTAPDGMFSLGLEEGRYRLSVSSPGFALSELVVDVPAGGEVGGLLVELEPPVEVVLAATLPNGAPPATLHVALASVGVSSAGMVEAVPLGGGRFALRSLGPGTWDLVVGTESDGATFERVQVRVPGPEVAVALRPAGVLEVSAPSFADGSARLELYDAAGIRYDQPFGFRQELFGGKGFVPGIPAGPWTVRLVAEDGRLAEASVVIEPGARARVEIP